MQDAESTPDERPGLDTELWVCRRPDSPLVHDRTPYRDAIDARSFRPVEIKACQLSQPAGQASGRWRFRRPQHRALRRREGYYVLVVYAQARRPDGRVHLRPKHALSITPSDLEARCEVTHRWRSVSHPSYGRIQVLDVEWAAVVGDRPRDVGALFERAGEPAGPEATTDSRSGPDRSRDVPTPDERR
jgi:hypothetical protein